MDNIQGKAAARKSARRILWQWGNTVARVRRLREEKAAFLEMANMVCDTIRSPGLDGMPRSGRKRDLLDTVIRAQEERERYLQQAVHIDQEIMDALRMRNAVEALLTELDTLDEKILTYRYVDNRSWQFIAMKLCCDERTARRIDARICDHVAEHLIVDKISEGSE